MARYDESRILLCLESIAAIEPSEEAKSRALARVRKAITSESGRSERSLETRVWKFAAAAAVILSIGLGIIYLSGKYERVGNFVRQISKEGIGIFKGSDQEGPAGAKEQAREKEEFGRIEEMFAAGDAKGLADMLEAGTWKSKIAAANYLAKMGDASVFESLEKLSREWGVDDPNNPFEAAITKIKRRLEQEKQPQEPCGVTGGKGGTKSEPADERIDHKGVLDIYVIDKDTKKPLADVKVKGWVNYDEETNGVTDKDGWYGLKLSEGQTESAEVSLRKDDFVPVIKQWKVKIPEIYTFELERGVAVGGIVQTEAGEPIADANVYLKVARNNETGTVITDIYPAKTDSNGRWQSDMVPADVDSIWIRLEHLEYISDENYEVRPCPPISELRAMTDILVMQKGVEVTGQVLDFEGRTIVGGIVGTGKDRWSRLDPKRITDSYGRFRFGSLRPGKTVFTFKGGKGYSPELIEVDVSDGMAPIEVTLWPGYKLFGKVVDSNGMPLANVLFRTRQWRGYRTLAYGFKTDENGRFEWLNAPGDEISYDITKDGYVGRFDYKMSASMGEQIIFLSGSRKVIGKVVDAETGEPIKQFGVEVGSYIGEVRIGNLVWQSGEKLFKDGGFETELSGNGVGWAVKVETDGYETEVYDVNGSGEGDIELNFKLKKGNIIRGTVYLPDGEVASGAEMIIYSLLEEVWVVNNSLALYSQRGKTIKVVRADSQGRYAFTPPSGEYAVFIIHNDGCAKVLGADLKEDSDIPLEAWGRVEGRLVLGGKAGGYQKVGLYYINDIKESGSDIHRYYDEVTDANGNFVFEKVMPGNIRVQNEERMTGEKRIARIIKTIEVKAGETVQVNLGSEGGRTVLGRLAMPVDFNESFDGRNRSIEIISDWPEAPKPENYEKMTEQQKQEWYEAWQKSEERKMLALEHERGVKFYGVVIEKDGTFRAEGIEEGRYILQARMIDRLDGKVKMLGGADYRFTIGPAADGDNKPLDVGVIRMEFWK